jgi:NADH-quinone oxidoreductase subunit I
MIKNYLKNTWEGLYTVLVGMKITWKHLFVPSVTLQYPEERAKLPERARNRLFVNINDCIGCMQCATACPVNCIDIETVKRTPEDAPEETSNGKKKALWVTKFEIDTAKCCFCQLCVFPCPTECIQMTDVYEYSEWDRDSLVYTYSNMTLEDINIKQLNFEKFQAEKEAKKIAMAKAKAEAAAKKKAEEEKAKLEEKPSDDKKEEEN